MDIRWVPWVESEELMKHSHWACLVGNLVSSPFDFGAVFWTLNQLGDFIAHITYAAIMVLAWQ